MKRLANITTLCLVIAIMAFTSCTKGKAKMELVQIANELNRSCPFKYEDGSVLESATIVNDQFTLNYASDPAQMDLKKFKGHDDLLKKIFIYNQISNKEFDEASSKLIIANYGLTVNCRNNDDSHKTSFTITAKELQEIKKHPATKDEMLDTSLEIAKLNIPPEIEKGFALTNMTKDSKNVYFIYTIDEKKFDLDAIKSNLKPMKEEAAQNIKTTDDPTITYTVETNRGLVLRYQGNKSDKIVDCTFTNDELRVLTHNVMIEK